MGSQKTAPLHFIRWPGLHRAWFAVGSAAGACVPPFLLGETESDGGYTGVVEKEMESIIVHLGYIGVVEKKMEIYKSGKIMKQGLPEEVLPGLKSCGKTN